MLSMVRAQQKYDTEYKVHAVKLVREISGTKLCAYIKNSYIAQSYAKSVVNNHSTFHF